MVSTRRARDLGQNFLVDRNIVGVIERLAELGPVARAGADEISHALGWGRAMVASQLLAASAPERPGARPQ